MKDDYDNLAAEFLDTTELLVLPASTDSVFSDDRAYTAYVLLAFGIGEFCEKCFALHPDPFDKTCYATEEFALKVLGYTEPDKSEDVSAMKFKCTVCA